MENAMPILFWSKDGYGSKDGSVYYGYGCMTFDQSEYVRLVVNGERSKRTAPQGKVFDSTNLEIECAKLDLLLKKVVDL